jgi:hypothetical protein
MISGHKLCIIMTQFVVNTLKSADIFLIWKRSLWSSILHTNEQRLGIHTYREVDTDSGNIPALKYTSVSVNVIYGSYIKRLNTDIYVSADCVTMTPAFIMSCTYQWVARALLMIAVLAGTFEMISSGKYEVIVHSVIYNWN